MSLVAGAVVYSGVTVTAAPFCPPDLEPQAAASPAERDYQREWQHVPREPWMREGAGRGARRLRCHGPPLLVGDRSVSGPARWRRGHGCPTAGAARACLRYSHHTGAGIRRGRGTVWRAARCGHLGSASLRPAAARGPPGRTLEGRGPMQERRVRPDAVYGSRESNRWFMQHVREVVGTATLVDRAGPVTPLPVEPRDLSAVRLDGGDGRVAARGAGAHGDRRLHRPSPRRDRRRAVLRRHDRRDPAHVAVPVEVAGVVRRRQPGGARGRRPGAAGSRLRAGAGRRPPTATPWSSSYST